MNATPEQIEAWKARKKAGATLQQQVHQQLVDQGMARERTIAAAPSERPAQTDRERLVVWRAEDVKALETGRPWQGSLERKPWHYQVTAVIPHRNTPEHLELCIQFLQQQTERPYIMIIDTGSDDSALTRVLALRSDSIEVHQVACHATQEYADVVCYAMDLAMSACRTEYLWCLHSDCFVINRQLLAELLAKADGGKHPVIGYESVSAQKHPECQGMVSHTCTLLHMPTMDQLDICWSTRRLQQQMQSTGRETITDVEMALNHRLRDRGITPILLGPEQPNGIERDANRVHLRSGTLAAQIQASQNGSKHEVDETIAELQGILATQRRDAASFEADSDIDFVVKDLPTCIKGYAVSIIVTARNYSCFLRECLQSCIRQTVPVVDIIYSDDCSNDNSVAIAMSFPEVTVLAHKNHLGVCEARNRGVAACKGELLCHVDGDDILPDDFIQRHLEAIRDDIPFVYCAAQAFGLHESRWTAPSWRERSIWHNNYVNTSALIWRWAFEAAGKWQETASKTMWDWNLALRLSRFGVPAVSNATLLYRQHANSWSHKEQEEALLGEKWTSMLGPMRREVVRVSFCTVYSGRLPDLLPLWCQQVAFAAIDTGIKPEWLILDNSMDSGELLAQCTTRVQRAFSSIRIIPFKERRTWATEIERRNGVADFMARACTRLLREAKGELVYFVEDDVIVPRGGFGVLYHSITNGHPLTSAVAGLYRNRHAPSFVGGWFKPQVREIESEPEDSKPIAVDFTGTGCLLFWRPLCPDYFQSLLNGIPAHDWWWGMELQRSGGSLLIMPKVRCRHYTTGDTWR